MGKVKSAEQAIQELTEAYGGTLPYLIDGIINVGLDYANIDSAGEFSYFIEKRVGSFCDFMMCAKSAKFTNFSIRCGYTFRLIDVTEKIRIAANEVDVKLLSIDRGWVHFEGSDLSGLLSVVTFLMLIRHCAMFNWGTIYKYDVDEGNLSIYFDTKSG